MKKLTLVLAIVLGMATMAFAQDISTETYEERGLFGKGGIFTKDGDDMPLIDFDHGDEDDHDAQGPLGSGILLLTGMGAAYLLSNKKKD